MTLRNMCAKVTPKPLKELVNVPTSHLLRFGVAADGGGRPLGHRAASARTRRHLQVDRWYGEAAGRPGGELLLDGELARLAAGRPEERDQQDHDHHATDHQPLLATVEAVVGHPDTGQ